MYELYEINSIEQASPLSRDWQRLLALTERANFFQTLPWLQVYWKHFGQTRKLRLLVVKQAGSVLGILPLVVVRERRKLGTVRVLTWPLDDWGSFYGPIGGDLTTLLTLGLDHIARTSKDWDLIDLRWMDKCGRLAEATRASLNGTGLTSYTRTRDTTALVDTRGTWDEYLAERTSKWRNNYRRSQRKLAERGEVVFERFRPAGAAHGEGDPAWEILEQCTELAQRSWQGASQTGTTLSHDEIREFIRDVHEVAAREGCLDVNLLKLDGHPVAYTYNYCFQGLVSGLRAGYDAEFAREGVGQLVYCHALRDSFERDDHTYDLGVGSLETKKNYWTDLVDLVQFTHFRRIGLRAQALRWKGCLTGQIELAQATP